MTISIKKIFNDLKTQYLYDFKHDKLTLFLESVGTCLGLGAAFTLAFTSSEEFLFAIFLAYLINSISWLIAGVRRSNSFLIVLNIGFTIINVIGLINAY